jgi:hypothetical protein
MLFGGTGYAEIELNDQGIQKFEAALEFGALVVIDFLIARGEVHALGGVRFELETLPTGKSPKISGYLRIGGSVSVLGLVSVSIEIIIELSYQPNTNALVGRAKIVVVVDLTLWSDSMEIDSGEWRFLGSQSHLLLDSATGFAQWQRHRKAYVERSPGTGGTFDLAYESYEASA